MEATRSVPAGGTAPRPPSPSPSLARSSVSATAAACRLAACLYVDGSCRRCSAHPPTDRYRYGRCNAWSRPGRAVLTGRVTTSREHRPSVRCDCDVLQYAGRFVFYQTESRDIGPTLSRISRHETYNSRASMPVSGHCFCPNVVVCHRGCSQLYFSVARRHCNTTE